MEFTSVPIIVISCYIIGEVYKIIFKNKQQLYKYIPLILAVMGGFLGVLIYFTSFGMMLDADNVWVALTIGIVSGASATGTNQIIKQLFKKEGANND